MLSSSYFSKVRDLMADALQVGSTDGFFSSRLTVLFRRFVTHQMVMERARSLELSGAGSFQPFLCAGV